MYLFVTFSIRFFLWNYRSIGLFCHSDEPGELKLAHGCSVNLVSLADPEDDQPRNFFEALANHILPVEMDGQFDIFVPLAASGRALKRQWNP